MLRPRRCPLFPIHKGCFVDLVYMLDWSGAGGKRYIGKTNRLTVRLATHRKSTRNTALRRAFEKHG